MREKKYKKVSPLPRSILSSLHEPLIDPRDGHGARSMRDVMILQKWNAAKKGDDDELVTLLRLIIGENLSQLRAAKRSKRIIALPARMEIRSVAPAMAALRMVTIETIEVEPEFDGANPATTRKKIIFEDWFEDYALGREGVDPKIVQHVRDWIARGSIHEPDTGDEND